MKTGYIWLLQKASDTGTFLKIVSCASLQEKRRFREKTTNLNLGSTSNCENFEKAIGKKLEFSY